MCLLRALRKVRHCAANRALTGRIFNMIKVLFICHGRIKGVRWEKGVLVHHKYTN